jgi:transposase
MTCSPWLPAPAWPTSWLDQKHVRASVTPHRYAAPVTVIQAGADVDRAPRKDNRPVAMLAEQIDGVIGVDTHRDTHHVEIAYPSGAPIATCSFSNDGAGHAEVLAWVFEHAPGPRLVMSVEGTRSYGAGLARVAAAAGIPVIEAEQPTRKTRRGKGKSDPIDAHLAVLFAVALDADKLPTPRADGDREALRILLCARHELTTTSTGQTNRLRALLRDGDDRDRHLARARLTDTTLSGLARRRLPREASREQTVRHCEIRRLAMALRQAGRALKANRAELAAIVHDLAPGLIDRPAGCQNSATSVDLVFLGSWFVFVDQATENGSALNPFR